MSPGNTNPTAPHGVAGNRPAPVPLPSKAPSGALTPPRSIATAVVAGIAGAIGLAALAHAAGPDVLMIQHAPDGPIEQAGTVIEFRYLGATMLVEWVDTTTDPIFRSGFEAAP